MMNEVPAPNERSKEIRSQLMIFICVFAAVQVLKFIAGQFPIQDLISLLFLWCGFTSLNYCYMSFFVLMTFFSMFQTVNLLGTMIQNGIPMFSHKYAFLSIVSIISLASYIYGYYICLIAYREFKGLMKEGRVQGGMNMGAMGGGGGGRGAYQRQANDNENPPAQGGNFNAFGGQGVTIG